MSHARSLFGHPCLLQGRQPSRFPPRPGHPGRVAAGPDRPGWGGGSDPSRRLILPGQDRSSSNGGPAQRLFTPGQASPGQGMAQQPRRPIDLGTSGPGQTPSPVNKFRPPPGFMDGVDKQREDAAAAGNPRQMLEQLRAQAGTWYELAALLPQLQRAGYDSMLLEQETGVERRQQNIWQVASNVYRSLKDEGAMGDKIGWFNSEEGSTLLYELRFLTVVQRTAAAEYVVDQQLSLAETVQLAKAVKDYERKQGHREGFTAVPGDCLAFKYFRDAQELRRKPDKEYAVQRGLAAAVTDKARAVLEKLVADTEQAAAAAGPATRLEIVRLMHEEVGFAPVAVAGTLQEATPAQLQAAPVCRQRGAFNAFVMEPSQEQRSWVALPAWNSLGLARSPVALTIPDCSRVEPLIAQARTKEDKARLAGPGLLLIDRQPESTREPGFYIAAVQGHVQLIDERQADGSDILGRVLLCCRPPRAEYDPASETAQLLQV